MVLTKMTFTVIICLINILFLIFIYFSKNRMKNEENKIYRFILILNSIGLILHLLADFVSYNYIGIPEIISFVILKFFLIYYFLFGIMLLQYLLIIAEIKNIKLYNNLLFTITSIITLVIFILPYHLHRDINNMIFYTDGIDVQFVYTVSAIVTFFIICVFILKKNFISKKKIIPLFIFIIGGIISILVQKIYPDIVLIDCIEAVICWVMYFTIENPDMKMLDEVYRAKEISDHSNEEKTMFIYNMTNEIRQITKNIDKSADNILDEIDNEKINVEYIDNNTRDIKMNTSKFTTMTNEIFDISEIDSSNIKTYDNKYNIKLLFKELIKTYKIESENKNIKFISSIETDIPEYLYGDNINLRKVLTILLDNAIKNTNEGSIEFNVSVIKKQDLCRLVITIEDTGIGMTPQELNNILNKKEENDEEKLNVNDTVYNAKKIITLMGGALIPSSVINLGTKIKVVLDQKIVRLDKDIDKYSKIYDKKKIAIVDNNESSIKIFKKLLDDENVIVEIFNYGQELLDKVRKNDKYDIVLLAEEIEPLNAFEIINKLKEVSNFNSKVILVTRNNNYEYDEEYKEYGFNDYLLKPIDKDKLIKIINE